MKQPLSRWLRMFAVLLALAMAGETTGAIAAVVVSAPHSDCCHDKAQTPACPLLLCSLGCCPARTIATEDGAIALNFRPVRERWLELAQVGQTRTDEPLVPPPRG